MVVRALLDVPVDERRGGALFDRALALGELGNVADLARRAANGTRVRRLAVRARERLHKQGPAIPSDWQLLLPLLLHLDGRPSRLRELLGEEWWRWAVEAGPVSSELRRMLWNVLAVEALAEWAETTPWPPRPSVRLGDRTPVSREGVGPPCAG